MDADGFDKRLKQVTETHPTETHRTSGEKPKRDALGADGLGGIGKTGCQREEQNCTQQMPAIREFFHTSEGVKLEQFADLFDQIYPGDAEAGHQAKHG